jgi:predicted MFS family arabinose efflux permease
MSFAATAVVCGSLPLFLVSAQAVQIRGDLGFGHVALGGTAALFNGARALSSVPMGRLADRLGGRRSVCLALLLTTAVCAAVAVWAVDYRILLLGMAVAGIAQGLGTSSATLLLATRVPRRMIGWSVGIQQAGVPAAAIVAGVAVPVVALTMGWRWSFAMAAVLAAAAAAGVLFRLPADAAPRTAPAATHGDGAERGPVLFVAIGVTFAAAASFALTTFIVDYAVLTGASASASASLLTFAAALTVLARIASGYRASRGSADQLGTVVAFLAVGTLGFVALISERMSLIVIGTGLAAAFCWSITGLVYSTVVQFNRDRPAAATGIALTGTSVGGVTGPVAFGFVVEQASYAVAWGFAAVLSFLSIGLMAVGRRQLLAGRQGGG